MGCVLCEASTTPSARSGSQRGRWPCDVSSLSDTALEAGLAEIASARSRLAASEAAMVAEIGRRNGNAREKLREQSRMSATDARRGVETAAGLEELPATSDALQAGQVSAENARLLARSANGRRGTDTPVDETDLLPKAREQAPDRFAKTLRSWETFNRPDAARDELKRQRRARKCSIWEDPESGMHILRGEFDPVAGSRISAALGAMTDRFWRDEHGKKPIRPESSVRQRRADAIEQLICGDFPLSAAGGGGEHAVQSTTPRAPATGVTKKPGTTLLVIADFDTVTGQLHNGRLANGTPLPTDEIARLACEADLVPAFFDAKGRPLWLGRSQRLATPAQRIAVTARDQGCIACGAAPEWCQVHHIDWWRKGGPTDIDSMCLLCSEHHHLVHEGDAEVVTTDTGFKVQQRRSRSR